MTISVTKFAIASVAAVATLGASACTTPIGGNSYGVGQVGQVNRVEEATVVAVRPIRVEGGNTAVGTTTGAVVGGIAGSQVGGDEDARIVGGIVGAVVGGIAGNAIQNGVQRQTGFAYTVRLGKSGDLVTITQGSDIQIPVGAPVFVEYGARPRVIPRY
jgi:outer membrane lipoprotein SlyB